MLSTMSFKHPHKIVLSIARAGHGPRSFSSLSRPLQWGLRPASRTCSKPLGSRPCASIPTISRAPLRSFPQVRQFSSETPATEKSNMWVIYALIGVNGGIFLYWRYKIMEAKQTGTLQARRDLAWIRDNFTLSLKTLNEGRWWTLVTANFSHAATYHVAFNLLSFYYFGRLLAQTRGIRPLHLGVLCVLGIIGTDLGYLVDSVVRERRDTHAQGFSGICYAFLFSAACIHPWTKFYIFGVVPMPAWAAAASFFAYDNYRRTDNTSNIAHAAHMGGAVAGFLYYFLALRSASRGQSVSKIIQMLRQKKG